MKPLEQRKVYHSHGFLVQVKIGKKWVDIQGVADCTNTVIAMGGNPLGWKRNAIGLYIEKEWGEFIRELLGKGYKNKWKR